MKDLKQFNIQYIGLKEESHLFEYQIDKTFFDAFNFDEFFSADIKVGLTLVKTSTMLKLTFKCNGTIHVACDVSGEPFDLEVQGALPLIVNFGDVYNDEHEEIVVLPYSEFKLNIAQYIYEMIVLAIPTRRVHPKVLDGTLESKALEKLQKLRIKKEEEIAHIDPRWDKLKSLITEKKV